MLLILTHLPRTSKVNAESHPPETHPVLVAGEVLIIIKLPTSIHIANVNSCQSKKAFPLLFFHHFLCCDYTSLKSGHKFPCDVHNKQVQLFWSEVRSQAPQAYFFLQPWLTICLQEVILKLSGGIALYLKVLFILIKIPLP